MNEMLHEIQNVNCINLKDPTYDETWLKLIRH